MDGFLGLLPTQVMTPASRRTTIREGGRVSTGDLTEATGRSRPVVIRQLNLVVVPRVSRRHDGVVRVAMREGRVIERVA